MGSALLGALWGRGETPIWDRVGTFGVGPIRGIGVIMGEGGDPNMGPYRTTFGVGPIRGIGGIMGEEGETP